MSLSSENTERTCKCHCCPRAPRPAAHSGRSAPPGAPAAPPAHPMSPLPAPLHPAYSPVSSQSFRLEELRMVIRVQLWSSLRAGRSCVSSGRPPPSLPSFPSQSLLENWDDTCAADLSVLFQGSNGLRLGKHLTKHMCPAVHVGLPRGPLPTPHPQLPLWWLPASTVTSGCS